MLEAGNGWMGEMVGWVEVGDVGKMGKPAVLLAAASFFGLICGSSRFLIFQPGL